MTADPDPLFWMLDGVADRNGQHIVFGACDEPERFVQVLSVGGNLLDVEWRASTADELHRFLGVDVLVAHQVVLRCFRDSSGWSKVQDEALAIFGSKVIGADVEVDYAATGLSICNAMVDQSKRRRNRGLPALVPPVLRWGAYDVATGDVWRDLEGDVEILVKAEAGRDGYRQGISLSAQRPVLSTAGGPEQSEVLLWPSEAGSEFSVKACLAGDEVRVTNVYRAGDEAWSSVERWTENAGFWVSIESPRVRRYHANYPLVTPPAFDDLVFSVEVRR